MKTCPHCQLRQPLEAFGSGKSATAGCWHPVHASTAGTNPPGPPRCSANRARAAGQCGALREERPDSAALARGRRCLVARRASTVRPACAHPSSLAGAAPPKPNTHRCCPCKKDAAPFAGTSAAQVAISPSTMTTPLGACAVFSVFAAIPAALDTRSTRTSSRPTSLVLLSIRDPVVQRPSTPGFHPGARGFESRQGRQPRSAYSALSATIGSTRVARRAGR